MIGTGKTTRADPAHLQEKAKMMSLTVREVEKDLAVMERQISRLKRWEGEAGHAFFKKYSALSREAAEVIRALSACVQNLHRIAGSYQETEGALKQEMEELTADILRKR